MISGSCLLVGMIYSPESVRWYLKQDRVEEAWKSLSWVRASESEEVRAEFAEMQAGLAAEKSVKSGFSRAEILRGENRKRVVLGSLTYFFQQVNCHRRTADVVHEPDTLVLPCRRPAEVLLHTSHLSSSSYSWERGSVICCSLQYLARSNLPHAPCSSFSSPQGLAGSDH